jgi:hypothetical protein
MEILKHIACRVLAPLLLTAAGLLMIVVVPMNASQFLEEEDLKVQESESGRIGEYHTNGLIYMNITESSNQVMLNSKKSGSSLSR